VHVRVLGPVRVDDNGVDVALTPQLRRLLGLLVVADGAPVSADRLAEYIAEGRMEGSTVRTAVSRLRKVLGDRVESVDGGYRLALEADELDAARFEQLLARSKQAPTETRCSCLATALELWSGSALGELADEEWASAWCSRLDGLRVGAVEDLADGLIGAGRQREAIELLEVLVVEQPYRERPVGLLMRALGNDGRAADALRVYERFRVTLRDDAGLAPSTALRDLESELLSVEDARDRPGAVGPPLPSGTVTFLFTDIEGSTQRWADDEAAMTEALAAHDEVLREVVAGHGGVVFKHTGDGVCAVFESASGAVGAAVESQARLELPVRMGLHTGEAEVRDGDYFGPTLNRVARIMDAGHGGQILLSTTTAALAAQVATVDLGEHRLKGLSSPERIAQVGAAEFPALRVASASKGNLPSELTEFVGRTKEVHDLAQHVIDHRMVTLLGVGGTGKTRLAIETAHRIAPTFPDGCWLVELAKVVVPEVVPHAICTGLGFAIPERGDVLDYVAKRLHSARALLVIDNCEHLLEATADSIEVILQSCATVSVIATSREPLMVAGEQLVPLPSLASDEAVRLFVERVGAEAPLLELDARQMSAVGAICERLDRLPLAIELAASRARTMSPIEIETRLDERFRLLVGGRRSRVERHQTMRGTVDWSYELCTPDERVVFDRLSVFAGEFDTDGAVAVATTEVLDVLHVEDALDRLVDRSLVQRVPAADGTTRYRLLETMRAYAHEHLVAAGDVDVVRGRHAAHVASSVGRLSLEVFGPNELDVLAAIQRLLPDVLQAVDWCLDRRELTQLPKLACAGVMYASAGAAIALHERIADHLDASRESATAIPPLLYLGLTTRWYNNSSGSVELHQSLRQQFGEAVENGESLPYDALYNSPVAEWVGSGTAAMVGHRTFLERLSDAPTAIQWYHYYLAMYDLTLYDVDTAIALQPGFERLSVELGSGTALARYHGASVLIAEAQLDFAAALEHAERAVRMSGFRTPMDVLIALRLVRNAAKVRGCVDGADLRRPFEWDREATSGLMTDTILVSEAVALYHAGYHELGLRAAAGTGTPTARAHYAWIFRTMAPQPILDVLLTPDEIAVDRDKVVSEILALADDLDRHGVGRE
jgi:predicted ATPase/class 3 adenylate cyclase